MDTAISPSSVYPGLTVPSLDLLPSPAWPLWSSHFAKVDIHIFLLFSQLTAFGCSLCRCVEFMHTSAYQRGRESCLARGPGSAGVLCWQASVVKGSLSLCCSWRRNSARDWAGQGWALSYPGKAAIWCISGGGNCNSLASPEETKKINGQVLGQRTGVSGNGTKRRKMHSFSYLIRAVQ